MNLFRCGDIGDDGILGTFGDHGWESLRILSLPPFRHVPLDGNEVDNFPARALYGAD